ncbi:putative zinc finger, CCHC-type containing protein [Tanacetum coccineum]
MALIPKDVCNCESCLDEAAKIDDDEDLPKKRKSSQQKLKRRYEKGDLTVGLLGEPSRKFDYYVLYPKAEPSQPLSPPHKTPPSPHKPPPTSPPPPKLSPYNQKALSILHQDSPAFPITKDPSSLGNEAYQALEARNVTIAQTTLCDMYQLILNALVKLCNQKKFLAEFERTGKRLGTTCDDKYLQIKCKDKSSCDCHFARNCPDKKRSQALIQALNQVEPVDVSDLESLYSLDDEPSDSVLCTIAYSDFSSDDDSDTDSLESDSDFGVHMINPIPHVLPIQEDPPLPLAKIHLLTDAYAKPIPVIAFFDTGSSVSILNPNILPDHYWKPHHQNFMAANGEKFVIDKISVPINIRLFPKCVIKRRLLGSSSHGKDLLIGFDILHKLPNLRWTADDKFPLPQKKSLFLHLADAKVLSKFDLKSGFWQLVTKYGIMLSEKKMKVGVTTIQFLGMEISNGKYQPQPHVA